MKKKQTEGLLTKSVSAFEFEICWGRAAGSSLSITETALRSMMAGNECF